MKYFYIAIIALFSFSVTAQNAVGTTTPDAETITKSYKYKLILDVNQEVAFKQKVETYLTQRSAIDNQYSGDERLDFLQALSLEETTEMQGVLSPYQFELYKKLKPVIQPI
ncbi:hypothetical protein [Ulvibacter antarcticus]|uniref:GLPGLI family protein n=1 Tax=Ulvibacter antarcticus TaxID=442714 RepID=A0A3L9YWS4_9FLAO|nr:hypothetical protein [Ulvibacter antarcticus]RMA64277.1 hypothetical protein BXY75_1150 [Ulvibacter antarcticus]